jgi:hypothetical protein
MLRYFKRIKDILTYYDYQPMLFFLALYDVIWNIQSYLQETSGSELYFGIFYFDKSNFYEWQYFVYTILSFLIIIFLHNEKILTRLIIPKVIICLHILFGEIVYYIQIFTGNAELTFIEYFSLIIFASFYWPMVWIWILFQLLKKRLYLNSNT